MQHSQKLRTLLFFRQVAIVSFYSLIISIWFFLYKQRFFQQLFLSILVEFYLLLVWNNCIHHNVHCLDMNQNRNFAGKIFCRQFLYTVRLAIHNHVISVDFTDFFGTSDLLFTNYEILFDWIVRLQKRGKKDFVDQVYPDFQIFFRSFLLLVNFFSLHFNVFLFLSFLIWFNLRF